VEDAFRTRIIVATTFFVHAAVQAVPLQGKDHNHQINLMQKKTLN
jgi:hypothetical protein